MKKNWLLKATIMMTLVALLLSSCLVTRETPAPASPTEAPAAEEPANEAPAAEEPAETTDTEEQPAEETPGEAGEADWRNTPPYERYDETVVLTLVKGGQENSSLLPEGESIEDNRDLQYIEDTLNIDIQFNWVVPSDSYGDRLNLAITSGEIPDAMIVSPIQLQQLVEAGALEDMTPYIEKYANADILSAYEATEGVALNSATIDGKIWGVPNVQPQADAPLMVWVRQDWLDKLGLKGPETIEDIETIARAFIEQDPDGNGVDDTYGLTGTLQPVMVPSNLHGFDIIFNAFGAFPTIFHQDENGQVVYGSVQPEAKEALAKLNEWYKAGLIDPDFATKNTDTSNQIVVGGQGGIMIGPWWISWWPLNDSVANDPNANWQPFMIKDKNGEYTFSMGDYTNSFVVVRKGYEHPEVVLKILNIQNDLSYGLNDAPQYYENFNEIWSTLFPIPFLIEQPYVVENMGLQYQQALNGELDPATFSDAMKLEFGQIETDVASPRSDVPSWATRMARLDAALLLAGGYNEVRADPRAVRIYPTDPNWPSLKKMEDEAYLQIITGAQPVDYFDRFVEEWMASGGEALLQNINNAQ
ncbi:MAG: extracellular solute-binding protein [Chloroflexi bacterium]|nr:extracellular solute-binding protein [Chloroflexota bacterium]